MVEEDNEFVHDCGERESLGLTGSQESLVKLLKDRIVAGGCKCGHCLRPAPRTRSHAYLTVVLTRLPAMTSKGDLTPLLPAHWQPISAS